MAHGGLPESNPESFVDLIKVATGERWCVRIGCTTCGAMSFRKALRKLPRGEVIAGMRLMSPDFLFENSNMFRLIVREMSVLGFGRDLLQPLEGTAAGDQLQVYIEYQNRRDERRIAYAATQTPVTIAERRAKKKSEALSSTAAHRERKIATQSAIRDVAMKLENTETAQILEFLGSEKFDIPMAAIGGLVYKRLADYYKTDPIPSADFIILASFASAHRGHWGKLLDRVQPKHFLEERAKF